MWTTDDRGGRLSEIDSAAIQSEVEKAVRFLRFKPGVQRIWLFGSATRGRRLDWRSDLDFAVEGMATGDLASAWSELDELMAYPVDLIRWEEASEFLKEQIRATGKVLYET